MSFTIILKKSAGVLIALFIGAGTLFLLLRIYNNQETKKQHKELKREFIKNGDDKSFPQWDEVAEFFPDSTIRYTGVENGKTVLDVIYETDKKAFRKEDVLSGPKKNHLILGGCSFIFGIALPKNETLSSHLRLKLPDTDVMNMGHGGGGLHSQLRVFDLVDLKKEYVPEAKGTYVYFFYSDHLHRWKAHSSYLSWAQAGDVHYEWKNGKLEHSLLKDIPAYKSFHAAREAGIENAYIKGKAFEESSFSEEDYKDYVKGIHVLKQKYLKIYPKGRFVVALFPFSLPEVLNHMKITLKKENIEYYDLNEIFQKFAFESKRPDHDFLVPLDGHPNKVFNEFLSGTIIQTLGLK